MQPWNDSVLVALGLYVALSVTIASDEASSYIFAFFKLNNIHKQAFPHRSTSMKWIRCSYFLFLSSMRAPQTPERDK